MLTKLTDRIVTAEDIIDAGASYHPEEVQALVPEPIRMSELLDLDIPDADKVWGVLAMITDRRERVGAAAVLVRDVAHLTDDPSVAQCLDVCDRYARGGTTDDDLDEAALAVLVAEAAARARARDTKAAGAVAMAAARIAAMAAKACHCTGAAARTAARAAARAARPAAAGADRTTVEAAAMAARSAAERRQVELLRQLLDAGRLLSD